MADPANPVALPWARPSTSSLPEAPEYRPQLAPGQRIEVLWELTDVDSGASSVKWWGASTAQYQPELQPAVWKLRYDATEDYEEEEADVTFLCGRYLRHVADSSVLRWKLEGSPIEDDDEDDSGEETVVLGDISAAYEEMEREMGQTMEDAALRELKMLDPFQQRMLISGFSDYMNGVKAQLQQIVEHKDENYVVTEDDVRTILQNVKRNQS